MTGKCFIGGMFCHKLAQHPVRVCSSEEVMLRNSSCS